MSAAMKRVTRALAAAALGLAVAAAGAQTPGVVQIDGTLKSVHQRGSIRLGHRAASVPFSYLSTLGEPIGYSVELCKSIAQAVGEAVHKELRIEWVPVTAADRVDAVADGKVDLECGSTSNTLERRAKVAFSPTIFVAGTKLLVRREGGIRSYEDLGGKRVAVTAGTTNERAMRELAKRFGLSYEIVVAPEHGEALELLKAGRVDAFATDDVLLYGLVAQQQLKPQYQVVGDFLSYEPYGLMFRKGDPQFARVVNEAFQQLARDGEIERQYRRWFLRKLPLGVSIDLPMSPQLRTLLEATAVTGE